MIPRDPPVFIFHTLWFQAQDTFCLFELRRLSSGTHPGTASFSLTSFLCRLPLQSEGVPGTAYMISKHPAAAITISKESLQLPHSAQMMPFLSDQDLPVSSSPWTSPILFYTCTHSTRKWGHAAFVSVCLTSLGLKSSRFTDAITSSKPSSFKTESHSLHKYTYHSSSVYLFFSTDILVDSISWILWIMAYKCYQLYAHPHFNLFLFFAFTFVKVPPLSLTLIYKRNNSTKHILRLYKIFPLRSKAFRLRKH